ncbi:MAG: MBL fold metallo-hydrolase [Planctomycetes bacterium]|nr:MBL fold metallo-hydrolase [Planctomycetota bacterium]
MAPPQSNFIRTTRIGCIEVTSLFDGWLSLDGGAMFGIVPKVLWEKKIPADNLNRIKLALRPLLVRTPQHTLVVETGLGQALTARQESMYGVQRGAGLDEQVRAAGVDPSSVEHLLLTHLHWDHSGGACRKVDDHFVPTFAAARYWVNRREWKVATKPDNLQRQSYVPESLTPLRGQLKFVPSDGKVVPGVRFESTGGHTENHSVIWIEDGGEAGCFMGDILETTAHAPLPWISAYDLCAGESYRAREKLWPKLVERKATCFVYHDPVHAACKLVQRDGKYDTEPIT